MKAKLKLTAGWDSVRRLVGQFLCAIGRHKWKFWDKEISILNGGRPSGTTCFCSRCNRVEDWSSCLYGDVRNGAWKSVEEWAEATNQHPDTVLAVNIYLPNEQDEEQPEKGASHVE